MKRVILYLTLLTAIVFSACSKDDDNPNTENVLQPSMFEGEWYCEDNSTYMKFSYSSFTGVVYGNLDTFPIEGEKMSGRWLLYPATKSLREQVHYANSQYSASRDFKVMEIGKYSYTLMDLSLNTPYTYHKVVESKQIALGEEFDVSIEGLSPSSYASECPNIAHVSEQGRVKACGSGVTYICAKSGNEAVYVKVEVQPRTICYSNELLGTIDDVLVRYGTPDYSGPTETPTMVIVYSQHVNDTRLKYIHYRYDEETREVTQVYINFYDEEGFNETADYMRANYYDIYGDGTVYGVEEFFLNNYYYIQPLVREDDYVIVFTNMQYYFSHGYY